MRVLNRRTFLPLLMSAAAAAAFAAPASAATNGALFYTQSTATPDKFVKGDWLLSGDIRAINPDGTSDRAVITTAKPSESSATPSPGGASLVYLRGDELWRSGIDGAGQARVLRESDVATPSWSPDGRTIAYSSGDEDGGLELLDASTPKAKPRTLVPSEINTDRPFSFAIPLAPKFTPDGRSLVYNRVKFEIGGKRGFGLSTSLWTVGVDGSGARRLFRGSGDSRAILDFSLSPDGTRVVYAATPSGIKEPRRLFISNLDGSATRQFAIAPAGHSAFGSPAWSPDGARVAVPVNQSKANRGAELWSIDVATGTHTVLKKIAKGQIDDPAWVAAP